MRLRWDPGARRSFHDDRDGQALVLLGPKEPWQDPGASRPSADIAAAAEHGDYVGVDMVALRAEGVGLVQRLALLVGRVEVVKRVADGRLHRFSLVEEHAPAEGRCARGGHPHAPHYACREGTAMASMDRLWRAGIKGHAAAAA
jgi:hypothetical protein